MGNTDLKQTLARGQNAASCIPASQRTYCQHTRKNTRIMKTFRPIHCYKIPLLKLLNIAVHIVARYSRLLLSILWPIYFNCCQICCLCMNMSHVPLWAPNFKNKMETVRHCNREHYNYPLLLAVPTLHLIYTYSSWAGSSPEFSDLKPALTFVLSISFRFSSSCSLYQQRKTQGKHNSCQGKRFQRHSML
jgi:hypothetical protein